MSNESKLLNFDEWNKMVPASICQDPLGEFNGYQKACYIFYLAWNDCEKLARDVRGKAIAAQLIRSAGSISANMEEGFGRGFGRDYARFLVIALGSARETRGWYFRASRSLSEKVVHHRMKLCDETIGTLVTVSQQQRRIKNK